MIFLQLQYLLPKNVPSPVEQTSEKDMTLSRTAFSFPFSSRKWKTDCRLPCVCFSLLFVACKSAVKPKRIQMSDLHR